MPTEKDNDREVLNNLAVEIEKFCKIKNLEDNILENIREYAKISLELYGVIKFIVERRKIERKSSKFKDNILKLKILTIKPGIIKTLKIKTLDDLSGDKLKIIQNLIEKCSEIKGGMFSVWGNKISRALQKLSKIDMLSLAKSLAKMSIFNDNPDLTTKKHKKWITIKNIEKKIQSFKNSKSEYTIDDVECYCEIFGDFWYRISRVNNIMTNVLKFEQVFGDILDECPLISNIFEKDGGEIFEYLKKIKCWFVSLTKYELGKKDINALNKMSKIDVQKFKKALESKEAEKVKEAKEEVKIDQKKSEQQYKDNIMNEIKNHKSLIEKIIKKLEEFKNTSFAQLQDSGASAHVNTDKLIQDLNKDYGDLVKKITVIKTSEKMNEIEIIQFLKGVNQLIDKLSDLTKGQLPTDSKFEFSNDSISDADNSNRYKTIYTLKDNKLTFEVYNRNKLLSKLVIS